MKTLTVTENILIRLRFEIISTELKPGQRLNEVGLRDKLGVSSAPLREAFRILEREQLVVNIARRGSYVTDISLKDCQEVYDTRTMMECYCVDIFEKKGIRELPEVASCLAFFAHTQEPVNSSPRDRYEYVVKRHQFHSKLVEATGNLTLCRLYATILSKLLRYQYMYPPLYLEPALLERLKRGHEGIIETLSMGDYETARKTIKSHISHYAELIRGELLKMKDDPEHFSQIETPEMPFDFYELQV